MTNVEGMTKSETLPVRSFRDFLDDQAPATAGLQPYLFSENTGSPAPRPSEGVKKFDFRGEWASSPRPSPPEEEREKLSFQHGQMAGVRRASFSAASLQLSGW